jgi:AmmeMemoRadiSam system protein B
MSERFPLFRADVNVRLYREGDQDMLLLHDPFGYADGPILLSTEMIPVLESCDGETTFDGIEGEQAEHIRAFFHELDTMGYFESPLLEARKRALEQEFLGLSARPAVCAGSSYPEDPAECAAFLSIILNNHPVAVTAPVRAALIPHIDLRVAPHIYGAFNVLRDTEADLVVILGTSHYWHGHPLIVTDKDHETPLGIVRTDKPLVQALRDRLGAYLAPTDLAHKPEHSIEFHALFLRHIMGDRPFTILPVLVTGLHEHFDHEGPLSTQSDVADMIAGLREVVEGSGRKAVWLVSGDMAHVGQKFGDELPASAMMADVRESDRVLVDHLSRMDVDAYMDAVRAIDDDHRICGLSPTYLALKAARLSSASVLGYDVWDETETDSAVSFSAIAFH